MKKLFIIINLYVIIPINSSALEEISYAAPDLKSSMTDLMIAVNDDQLEAVKKLAKSTPDINKRDRQGRTALYIAARKGRADMINALMENKSIDLSLADNEGLTPLAIAVNNGHEQAVQALLNGCKSADGICPSIDLRDNKLQLTPLTRAQLIGNDAIIKLLLEAGANPTATIKKDKQPITIASLYKGDDKEVVNLMQNKEKEFNVRTEQFTEALRDDNIDQAKKILKRGININLKDKKGKTPLWAAIYYARNKDLVQSLLDQGADVNVGGIVDSGTALHIAAQIKNNDIVDLLIKSGANVNSKGQANRIPLHLAVEKIDADEPELGVKELIEMLVKAGADVNAKSDYGDTPLHSAADWNNKSAVETLIALGADVFARNKDGFRPVVRASLGAAHGKDSGIVDILQKAMSEKSTDKIRALDFIAALDRNEIDYAKKMLALGIDINAKNEYDMTPLLAAAMSGDKELISTLIKLKVDANAKSKFGQMPLNEAVKNTKDKEIIDLLINAGADVNAKGTLGNTPLHEATANEAKNIMQSLIEHKADVNAKNEQLKTPLHSAAFSNDKDFVEMLIKAGAQVNASDSSGNTPLMGATVIGNKDVVDLLINAGADINAKNNKGKTALDLAIERGKTEIAELLKKALASKAI